MNDDGQGQTSPSFSVTPHVLTVLSEPYEILPRYLHSFEHGGIFVPGHLPQRPGDRVRVEVAFARLRTGVQGLGVVRWRRLREYTTLPRGTGIEFVNGLGPVLLAIAENPNAIQPRPRRFSISVPAELRPLATRQAVPGQVVDISRSGVFVEALCPLAVGTVVSLQLGLGRPPMVLEAQVVRATPRGLGLAFCGPARGHHAVLDDLLGTVARAATVRPGRG